MNKPSFTDLWNTREYLKAWGRWRNDVLSQGLSYSWRNILAPLIDNKGHVIRSTQPQQVLSNAKAERVDALINTYARTYSKPAKVLRMYYLQPNLSVKEKIVQSRLPKTTYFRYLAQSEEWLCEQLFTSISYKKHI